MNEPTPPAPEGPDAPAQFERGGARIAYRIARPARDRAPGATSAAVPAAGPAAAAAGRAATPASPSPALVLVHGLASNLTRWTEYVTHSALRADWTLLRIDLRGHGGSLARTRVSLERWCEDLAAVLDAERIGRAVIAGHSLGAQVALAAAARLPERVAGLVLIDPVLRATLHGRLALTARAAPLLRLAARAVLAANALGLRRGALPPLDLRALDEAARIALRSPAAEAEFIRRYSSARADLAHVPTAIYLQDLVELFRAPPPLDRIGQPALVLLSHGATFSGFDATRAALAALPRATCQAIDCHHWPLTERPLEVREAMDAWCMRTFGSGGRAL